jgi:hypothetical protein
MSIYHLHIPRTSGVFIREKIIRQIDKPMFIGHRDPIPENISEYKYLSGHFATNFIQDFDINFAIYRNPIELSFSYINYMRDIFYNHLSLDELIEQYVNTDKIKNFVNMNSKFLTGTVDATKYNKMITDLKEVAESGWYVETKCNTIDMFVDIIQKNNTYLVDYSDDKKYEKISKLYEAEYSDIKINKSSEIESSTISKHIDLITDLNSFDLEVYEYLKK